ncbi:MAG: response regulator [Candidatus Acidiferrum sp.]
MASVVRTLKKVLVVDDNPAIRSEIHQEFNRHRSIAQMPKTAERVLEILPDLIILDLSMPVMKGLDAAPELKILPDCPIILYTLFADTLVQSSDVEARGITCVVAKDDSLDSLIDRANELLSERDRS